MVILELTARKLFDFSDCVLHCFIDSNLENRSTMSQLDRVLNSTYYNIRYI